MKWLAQNMGARLQTVIMQGSWMADIISTFTTVKGSINCSIGFVGRKLLASNLIKPTVKSLELICFIFSKTIKWAGMWVTAIFITGNFIVDQKLNQFPNRQYQAKNWSQSGDFLSIANTGLPSFFTRNPSSFYNILKKESSDLAKFWENLFLVIPVQGHLHTYNAR